MPSVVSTSKLARLLVFAAALAVGGLASAQVNLITNGNFEDPADFLAGWTATGNVTTSPELVFQGNSVAPFIDFNGPDTLQQDFTPVVSGSLDFYAYFASFSGTERIRLRGAAGQDLITLRVTDQGQLQRFSGSWGDVPGAIFSPQATYRLNVSAADLDTAGRSYDISWSDPAVMDPSGELMLTNTQSITGFHGAGLNPFGRMIFEAGSSGQYYIDEVTVVDSAVNVLTLVVDRDAGTLSLENTGLRNGQPVAGSVDFTQYSITTGFESLNPAAWTPIGTNIDVSDVANLAENGGGSTLGSLAVGQSISIGSMDAWLASHIEDLELTYTLPGGEMAPGVVEYVGNEVEGVPTPFDFGDLNVDGDVDAIDWQTYKAAVTTDVSALTLVEAYYAGDMDGNGVVELDDFPVFKAAYDDANGVAAFAAMLEGTNVPEPSAVVLAGLAAAVAIAVRRSGRTAFAAVAALLVLWAVGSSPAQAYSFADDFEDGFDAGWLSTEAATIETTVGQGAAGTDSWAAVDSVGNEVTFGTLGDILTDAVGTTNFSVDFYARVANLLDPNSRELNFQVSTNGSETFGGADNSNFAAINFRYQNGGFAVFSGGWQPLTDLGSLAANQWHRIQVTGTDWGLPGASYGIQVSDAGGSTFTRSVSDLAFYQVGDPTTQFAQAFNFNSSFGGNPGFDVDQVVATSTGPNLTLEVNTTSGLATIKSDAVFSFEIDAIEITSGTGGPGSLSMPGTVPTAPSRTATARATAGKRSAPRAVPS